MVYVKYSIDVKVFTVITKLCSFKSKTFYKYGEEGHLLRNVCSIWLCKLEKRGDEIKKMFPSETTEPISTKLCWHDP